MSLPTTIDTLDEYPESDGRPMGETDIHREWMIRIHELLRRRYAGERVYVGCDLLVYYTKGVPREFCSPDVFVVKDCEPGRRRVFRVWIEGRVPDAVFEVTSLGTRREDEVIKPSTYARIGVKEYFLYDPTGDYLVPPLQGFRLVAAQHEPIAPDAEGALVSEELGLRLWLDSGELVIADSRTGRRLLTEAEALEVQRKVAAARARKAQARADSAEARADSAEARADSAEARAEEEARARQAAEVELRRLREELERLKRRKSGGE